MLTNLPKLTDETVKTVGSSENPAPRLLASGVDVTQVARGRLPLSVWEGIEAVCLEFQKELVRWQLACLLAESCRQQLDRGHAESDVIAWLQSRAVHKLLAADVELRRIVCELSLPISICERVLWVFHRLGWWLPGRVTYCERIDGCINLCVEIESQLADGKRVEEILAKSKSTMYREVHRKMIQQRWLISRVFRRVRQSVAIILLVSVTIWGILFCQLIASKSGEAGSIFHLVNKAVDETNPGDRAWPLLREAHLSFGVQTYSSLPEAITSFTVGPSDPYWHSSYQLIEYRADAIKLAVEGSKKSVLGFKYLDDADSVLSNEFEYWAFMKTSWVDMPTYQSKTYITLDQLLEAAQLKAIRDKKSQVAFELLSARIRIKALITASIDMPTITQMGSQSGYTLALGTPEFLQDYATDVNSETLAELERAVLQLEMAVAPQWSGSLAARLEETIDAYFMPVENGTITFEGLRMLRKIATGKPELAAMNTWLGNPQPTYSPTYVAAPSDRILVNGPILAHLIMNRTELEELLGIGSSATLSGAEKDAKLIELLEKIEPSDYLSTEYQAIHHAPLVLLIYQYRGLKDLYDPSSTGYSSSEVSQLRAIQLACAIERYHQRTGEFPETLDLLLGTELSALPIDEMTELPLKYLRSENRYVIYSLGLDLVDQTAEKKTRLTDTRPVSEHDLLLVNRKFISTPMTPVDPPQN